MFAFKFSVCVVSVNEFVELLEIAELIVMLVFAVIETLLDDNCVTTLLAEI